MSEKTYIGIDPGNLGVIAVQKNGVFSHFFISDNDLYQLSEIIARIRQENPNIVCVMEQIHAIFGSSAKATFSFGEIFGQLKALLAAHHIPFVLIPPKEWQKVCGGR